MQITKLILENFSSYENRYEIDFSTVHYTIPGTYRYGIIQESSSDKSIVLEKKRYQIYVMVTKEEDNSIKVVMLKDFAKVLGIIIDKYKTPFLGMKRD